MILVMTDREGKFAGVFGPREDLSAAGVTIQGTAEDWEKTMLPPGVGAVKVEVKGVEF